ncbi:MAG: hypothetical protein ACLPXT_04930 [Terracidiphilus sp.]
MENIIEINQDSRAEWSTPELKKVDIEQITAGGSSIPSSDGGGFS